MNFKMKSWLKIDLAETVVVITLLLMAWKLKVIFNHLFLSQRFLCPSLNKQQDLISGV